MKKRKVNRERECLFRIRAKRKHPGRCPPIHCQSNPPITIAHSFHKVKFQAGIMAMNMLTLLLKHQSQPTLTLRIPPSKQLTLREIQSKLSTGLQKNMKNTESYKINQTQPSHLLQGFGTISMTPCKRTCTPFTN